MRQQIRIHQLLCDLEDAFRVDFPLRLEVCCFIRELLQSREKVGNRYGFSGLPAKRLVEVQ